MGLTGVSVFRKRQTHVPVRERSGRVKSGVLLPVIFVEYGYLFVRIDKHTLKGYDKAVKNFRNVLIVRSQEANKETYPFFPDDRMDIDEFRWRPIGDWPTRDYLEGGEVLKA
jgi:hypothetical protein